MLILKSLCPEKREITAPVLVPDEVDYHGDTYSEEEVHKACRNYTDNCNKANLGHLFDLEDSKAEFVENYVSLADMEFEDSDTVVKKGTWIATMKIKDDALWDDVKEGKFTGFSISASANSLQVQKAKTAGRAPAEEGIKVKKILTDFDFSKHRHHVALVDEAANGTSVLVLKSKTKKEDDTMSKYLEEEAKEELLKRKIAQEIELENVQKAKDKELEELRKAKEESDKEIEELRKAKEEADTSKKELEEIKKARELEEDKKLIQKARDLKTDSPETFGIILKKCKGALEDKEYEELEKQLDKLQNVEKAKAEGSFDSMGESGENQKTKQEEFQKKRAEYIEKGMTAPEASKKARLEIAKEENSED